MISSRRRLSVIMAATLLPSWVLAQDLPCGYLGSLPPTRETHRQDDGVRESSVLKDWVVHSQLHPKKRVATNLEHPGRVEFRGHVYELMRRLWIRGAMHDLYRVREALREVAVFEDEFLKDRYGKTDDLPKYDRMKDEEVGPELLALLGELRGTPPGFRLVPLDYAAHLPFVDAAKAPHAGAGQRMIEGPCDRMELNLRRLQFHFSWGEFQDDRIWDEKLKNLAESFSSGGKVTRQFLDLIASKVQEYHKKTLKTLEASPQTPLLVRKGELFERVHTSRGKRPEIDAAMELVATGEKVWADLTRSGGVSSHPTRNQMAGLALAISGAAYRYLEHPDMESLVSLGVLGVVGTPLILDMNGSGAPDLKDDDPGPDSVVDAASTVWFDLDGDGAAERVEWMKGGDGLLARDLDHDGRISSGLELFGDAGGYANGFAKLALTCDRNGNRVIEGEELSGLLVWMDDGDGETRDEELVSVEDLGITRIEVPGSGLRSRFLRHGRWCFMWDWYPEMLPPIPGSP